jgi:uncharacterized membrane protein YhiD involved in acid resistance
MDELIRQASLGITTVSNVSIWELVLGLIVSGVLTTVLAWLYIRTHDGHSYSRSFVHTQIFIAITVTLIMIIIGSNIARAFALVGAMSIIRFRNPIKDSRDLAFLFMAMAVGMAAGTGFFLFAIVFTLFVVFISLAIAVTGFGETRTPLYVVRVRMNPDFRPEVESAMRNVGAIFSLISIDRLAGTSEEDDMVYEIRMNRKKAFEDLVSDISGVSGSISVSLLVGGDTVNV